MDCDQIRNEPTADDRGFTSPQKKNVYRLLADFAVFAVPIMILIDSGILIYYVYRLFRADESSLALAVTVMAAFTALLMPLAKMLEWNIGKSAPADLSHKIVNIILLVALPILLLFLVLGYDSTLKKFAEPRLEHGLRSASFVEAQDALFDAQSLGHNIPEALRRELIRDLNEIIYRKEVDHTLLLARLFTAFAESGSKQHVDLTSEVIGRICDAASRAEREKTSLLVQVLAILNQESARELAVEFNNAAIILVANGNLSKADFEMCTSLAEVEENGFVHAGTYLEVVVLLDETIDTGRSYQQKSLSIYHLGYIVEQDDGREDKIEEAITLYRDALSLDANNLRAREALSTALLIHFPNDPQQLTDAIELAYRGRINFLEKLEPNPCNGYQPVPDESWESSWYCFRMITIEAGARMASGDSPSLVSHLIREALRLAEVNNSLFERHKRYTAEAYYYAARLSEPETDLATLCAIISERNLNDARHNAWAAYALEHIGDQICLPS